MKKLMKTGLLFLIIGAILAGIGIAHGGLRSVVFGSNGQPEINTTGKQVRTVGAFTKISADLAAGDITIQTGEKFQVETAGHNRQDFTATVRGGELTIRQPHNRTPLIGIFSWNTNQRIIITVPRKTKLSDITVHSQDGDVHLVDQNTQHLTIATSDGDTVLDRVQAAARATLKNSDGDMTMRNSLLSQATITASDGDVDLQHTTIDHGTANLSDGDFTANSSTFQHMVKVSNSDGDNTVSGANRQDGYTVQGGDDNALFGQHKENGTLTHNTSAVNHLYLHTSDGDNVVH
ncbi:MAG: DUF4097 family beta strand repeat-containing protein [Schleiferilactobacillus perolens]|uniref:DUF4097 family beta strand repeat-containing protein n=1 Tax=Schleiferilactobacillus perolens TaxID=100468 RepID=UPI0039EC3718